MATPMILATPMIFDSFQLRQTNLAVKMILAWAFRCRDDHSSAMEMIMAWPCRGFWLGHAGGLGLTMPENLGFYVRDLCPFDDSINCPRQQELRHEL